MKIKLPANADVHESRTGLGTVLVKMLGLDGWDIANKLAEENSMKIIDFCIVADVGVYCDHVVMNRSDMAWVNKGKTIWYDCLVNQPIKTTIKEIKMKLNQLITKPDFLLCIMHDAFKDNFMNKDRDILVNNSYFANKMAIRNCLYNLKLRGFAEYNDAGFWIVTDAGQNHAEELIMYYGFDFSDIRPNDCLYQNEKKKKMKMKAKRNASKKLTKFAKIEKILKKVSEITDYAIDNQITQPAQMEELEMMLNNYINWKENSMDTKKTSGWRMIVMKLKNIGTKKNPLAYTDSAAEDFIESVEGFFEAASIEVHYTEVERIAKDLADNGFSYWKNEFLFNIV